MNARVLVCWLSALALLPLLAGCGTPGLPKPPSLELPQPVEDFQATRKGNAVILAWSVPQETTDGITLRHLGPTRICRTMNQVHMPACAPVTQLPPIRQIEARKTLKDTLPAALIQPNSFATYAVEVQNTEGRSAGLSNQVLVPMAAVSNPQSLSQLRITPDALVLAGRIELSPAGATQERFVLQRREKGSDGSVVVAELPRSSTVEAGAIASLEFRDESFEWEKTYLYQLTTLATAELPNGSKIEFESDSTPRLEVTLHDVFPPAAPTGVQAVYAGEVAGASNFIDLTWNANTERDLAGYNVYRREESQPESAMQRINPGLVRTPSFRDTNIQKGKRYLYAVSAIDLRNNESPRSAAASEFVPQ
ncbi:MAG TPA: fibronectin type III domain-containing protein [Terriglobales bacterium]